MVDRKYNGRVAAARPTINGWGYKAAPPKAGFSLRPLASPVALAQGGVCPSSAFRLRNYKYSHAKIWWTRSLCLLFLLILLGGFPVAGSAKVYAQSVEPISLEAYREKLVAAAALLESPANPNEALIEADALLSTVNQVRLTAGGVIAPASIVGFSRIGAEESDNAQAADPTQQVAIALLRVRLLIEQIDRSADDDPATRLDALHAIFERSEFSQDETFWQRFINWLDELIAGWFPERASTGDGWTPFSGRVVAWAIFLVGGALLAFLLSYWLQGLMRNFVVDVDGRRGDGGEGNPLLTAFDARQQATQLAHQGDYRDAVRSLYLSALLSMEESGLVRHDRSLTNREVLRQLKSQGAPQNETIEEHLRPVVDTFDAVWYGVREPDVETFQSYEREIDGLAEAVDSSASQEQTIPPRAAKRSGPEQR